MKTLILTLLIATTSISPAFNTTTITHLSNSAHAICSKYDDGYNARYSMILKNMIKEMDAVSPTGNVNLDFVDEMIPHHAAGIAMAESIVKYGSNPKVKKIAEYIITSQKAQIPVMEDLKARFKKEPLSSKETSEKYLAKYNEIKEEMFKNMSDVKISDNVDNNFLQEMIYHHEGAIAMAKDILAYTKDPELIKIAENIVTTQSNGVTKMKDLLKASSH